jgi:DNA polymerase zeta
MNALEGIPLVMEPNSRFYTSPVLVLDFQSLYPSIMIAYNYCYSTCIGKIKGMCGSKKLGVLDDYEISLDQLHSLRDHVNSIYILCLTLVAPNGVVFVKPHIRRGVLGRMLQEILDTRVLVKKSMKLYKGHKVCLEIDT